MISNLSQFTGNDYRTKSSGLDKNFVLVTLMLAFIVIVIPNTVRFISIPLFFFAALLPLFSSGKSAINSEFLLIWIFTTVITFLYVGIGVLKGYLDAVPWTIYVYVISPMLWLLICSKLVKLYSLTTIIRAMIFFGLLGGISVFGFYYIFLNYGADSLTWLIATPNLNYENGRAHATMHVFGSLMFISGGFFAAPHIIKGRLPNIIVAIVFLAAAFFSGRAALMLSLPLGLLMRFVVSMCSRRNDETRNQHTAATLLIFVIVMLIGITVAQYYELDLAVIVGDFIDKIAMGGGDERVDQAIALWDGIKDSWGLGEGHGVGVSLIRNDDDPWRYELLWLATIFRVGFIGAIIYAIPAGLIIIRYARLLSKRKNSPPIDFIFAGFLASLIGSVTNPYYESFDFQWMLIFPYVYLMLYGKILENSSFPYSEMDEKE